MRKRVLKEKLAVSVWLTLAAYYFIAYAGLLSPNLETMAMQLINSSGYWNVTEAELTLIERLEALL